MADQACDRGQQSSKAGWSSHQDLP